MIPTLTWTGEGVRFIDQTKLPLEESYVTAATYEEVANAIVTMVVRGAPAIGVSAAYGVALGAKESRADTPAEFAPKFERICARLAGTRPTAVNLFWAIDRMKGLFGNLLLSGADLKVIQERLLAEAHAMYEEDIAACRAMGAHGGLLVSLRARTGTGPRVAPYARHLGSGSIVSVKVCSAVCGGVPLSVARTTNSKEPSRLGTPPIRPVGPCTLIPYGASPPTISHDTGPVPPLADRATR